MRCRSISIVVVVWDLGTNKFPEGEFQSSSFSVDRGCREQIIGRVGCFFNLVFLWVSRQPLYRNSTLLIEMQPTLVLE